MKNYILALLLCSVGVFYAQTEGSGKYAINQLTVNSKNSDFGTAFYGEDKLVFAINDDLSVAGKPNNFEAVAYGVRVAH